MKMTFRLGVVVVMVGLGLAFVMSDSAVAQRRGGGGFGRMFRVSKVDLAVAPDVQSELKMTDEQKTKVQDISDQLREDRRDLFGGSFGNPSETFAEMERLNREASEKVDGVLDDAQQKRLRGIAIQVNGPAALNDETIVKDLNLSDEQKTKLEEVRDENNQAMRDAFSNAGDLSREERRDKMRELGDAANEKLLAVLNADQQAKFEEMKGDPFEFDRSQLRRGGGGGGGGFGGRRNRGNN
jgi:Spy/CpxP family protein refolding chaperone